MMIGGYSLGKSRIFTWVVWVAFIGTAVAALAILVNFERNEPSYNGETLSAWLARLNEPSGLQDLAKVQEAIIGIGTNALPYLLRNVVAGPVPGKAALENLLFRLNWIKPKYWFNRRFVGHELLVQPSLFALQMLGTNAAPVIEPLLLHISDPKKRDSCLSALFAIGPAADPFVQQLCGHSDPVVRAESANYLARVVNGSHPFKIQFQHLPSGELAFGFFPVESTGYELTRNLKHTNRLVRSATIETLKQRKPSEVSRNVLETLMAEGDEEVKRAAQEVFVSRYPEDAAKKGIK